MSEGLAMPRDRGPPMGWCLAIEASSALGSVALAFDRSVVARRLLSAPGAHASKLVPAVRDVLKEAGVGARKLAGVVVGSGPGSFTGVRIGVATASGLATSLDIPLYTVSSLRAAAFTVEALGAEAAPLVARAIGEPCPAEGLPSTGGREIRYVLFDARRGRVYGACYDVGEEGPVEVISPHGGTVIGVLNGRPPAQTVFAGDGARVHTALLEAAGYSVLPLPAGVPVADAVLACCPQTPSDPRNLEPDYIRNWKPA